MMEDYKIFIKQLLDDNEALENKNVKLEKQIKHIKASIKNSISLEEVNYEDFAKGNVYVSFIKMSKVDDFMKTLVGKFPRTTDKINLCPVGRISYKNLGWGSDTIFYIDNGGLWYKGSFPDETIKPINIY